MQPPRAATVAKVVAAAVAARLLWRTSRFLYNVLTSVPPAADLHHNCIPPKDWKHAPVTDASTRAYIQQHYPELLGLVDRGNLVVMQPAAMLAELMQQQQAGAATAASQDAAAAAAAEGPNLTQEDIAELLASPQLQACMSMPLPRLLVLVGTVHVAKQSGEDVARVIEAMQPSCVALELCRGRLQAMLMDPYADPLWDTQPCPLLAAQQAAARNRSIGQILTATLQSRDHNVLATALQGMYSYLEDQLNVKAGVEFIAARKALIELLRERQAAAAASGGEDDDAAADAGSGEDSAADAAAISAAAADAPSQQQQQQQQGQEQQTWLQMCVAADRPVMSTLMGFWGALGPWKRLETLGGLIWMLLWRELDEELIGKLANEDLVDSLLAELAEESPELLKPLLHDRNWVLATNTWCAAQRTEGPVVSIVGKGHLPGMVYAVQQLVGWMAKTGGHPIRIAPADVSEDEQATAV